MTATDQWGFYGHPGCAQSGVASIQYSLDSGKIWLPYFWSVLVPNPMSARTLEYRAVNFSGLTSAVGTATIPAKTTSAS